MNAAENMIAMAASEVMPGDYCRIDGCWETVYAVGADLDGQVTLLTHNGDHTMAATALIEIPGAEA